MSRLNCDGISTVRREELMRALKAVWTHDSTAIEGVDLISRFVDAGKVSVQDVKLLHRTVVTREVMDVYKPIGDWKREDNGTYNSEDGRPAYMPYAAASETPGLMDRWLDDFNGLFDATADKDAAIDAYLRALVSFVRIHLFFDGNGRLARLLANLPVLYAGLPLIVVPNEARSAYINALWSYLRTVGPISCAHPNLLPESGRLARLKELVHACWKATPDLVDEARVAGKGK